MLPQNYTEESFMLDLKVPQVLFPSYDVNSPAPLFLSQALGLLVPVRSIYYYTSTPGLSTSSS